MNYAEQITDPIRLARLHAPETSKRAARSLDASRLEALVYETIKSFGGSGCISDDVRARLPGLSYSSVTARFVRLAEREQIVYRGSRKGASGRSQRIMVAASIQPELPFGDSAPRPKRVKATEELRARVALLERKIRAAVEAAEKLRAESGDSWLYVRDGGPWNERLSEHLLALDHEVGSLRSALWR